MINETREKIYLVKKDINFLSDKIVASFYQVFILDRNIVYDPNFSGIMAVGVRKSVLGNWEYYLIFSDRYFEEESSLRFEILAHEFLHVIYNHSIRILNLIKEDRQYDRNSAEIAVDVVVNRKLPGYTKLRTDPRFINFHSTSEMFDGSFWYDCSKLSFEAIYYKIKSYKQKKFSTINNFIGIGDGENLELNRQRELPLSPGPKISRGETDTIRGMGPGKFLTEEDLKEIEKLNKDVVEEAISTTDKANNYDLREALNNIHTEVKYYYQLGLGLTKYVTSHNIINSTKWNEIVKSEWRKFKLDGDEELWGIKDRRRTSLKEDFILPIEKNQDGMDKHPEIWVFIDVSGSCEHLYNLFVSLVCSIPNKIKARTYVFHDRVIKIPDPRKSHKAHNGSGWNTNFQAIENCIQTECYNEGREYPSSVVIITDGAGGQVFNYDPKLEQISNYSERSENPKKWFWVFDGKLETNLGQPRDRLISCEYDPNGVIPISSFLSR